MFALALAYAAPVAALALAFCAAFAVCPVAQASRMQGACAALAVACGAGALLHVGGPLGLPLLAAMGACAALAMAFVFVGLRAARALPVAVRYARPQSPLG